jgi:hypothetical protein
MPIIHQKSWFDHMKNFSPIFGPQSPYFLFHKGGNPVVDSSEQHVGVLSLSFTEDSNTSLLFG